jgi:hypothetical protein
MQQPTMQQPVVQQPGAPFAPSSEGGRRAGLIGVGALLIAAGAVSGVVMLMASSSNYDEGVENLARAPIGCTTSLEFDEAGTYTIYVETTGQVGELRGDCPNSDDDYAYDDDDLPDVEIVLVDDRGDEVDLDDDESKDYDAGGYVGRSVASVEIEEAGDFEITATSDEDEIAVAIGRNPKESAGSTRTMGILALALGVAIGGFCIVLGTRRRPATPATTSVPGAPGGYPGAAPTGTYGAGQYSPPPPVTGPPAAAPPAPTQPSYQPPAYQPPGPPAAPPAMPTTPPTPPTPPAPPAPPAGGGPSWPAPPNA